MFRTLIVSWLLIVEFVAEIVYLNAYYSELQILSLANKVSVSYL